MLIRWIGRSARDAGWKTLIFSIDGRAIQPPWPVFHSCAQTSRDRIIANVIDLRCELLAAFIVAQAMIEVTFLPDDAIVMRMVMLPVANHPAHLLIAIERQQRMNVIGHY